MNKEGNEEVKIISGSNVRNVSVEDLNDALNDETEDSEGERVGVRRRQRETVSDTEEEFKEDIELDQIKLEEIQCDQCPKECYGQDELVKHKRAAHDTREFTCEECGKSITGSRAFYSHRRRHKKFQCPKCRKHLVVDIKARHIRKCSGIQDKVKEEVVKKCHHEGCSYTTHRNNNLKRHELTHLTCDVVGCGMEFRSKKKLDAHKRKVHKPIFASNICPKQGPKKHSCGWCGYETSFTTHIKKHEKICASKKRAEGPDLENQIGKDELGLLYSMTNKCSIKEFNVILDFFIQKFGKEWFEKGAKTAVSEYCNSLDFLHDSEEMIFEVIRC